MLFTQILNRNTDFQRLYRCGAFCSLGQAILYVMPNGKACNRLGITAGKKVGNAVKRNRAKRIIRAAYAASEEKFPIGLDIVIVARSGLPEQNANVLTAALSGRGARHMQDVGSGKIKCGKNNSQSRKPNRNAKPAKKPGAEA